MPARLPLLLAAAALATAAAAQPLPTHVGHDEAPDGTVEVRADDMALTFVTRRAPVAARLSPLALPQPALDARAADLLDAWVRGDLDPLAAAVRPDQRADAAASFGAYRAVLAREHGPVVAARVVGSFRRTDGRTATLARIQFGEATEWASFIWTEGGRLLTFTRGLGPVVVATLCPIGRDAVQGAAPAPWLSGETDDRSGGLALAEGAIAER